MMPEEEMDQSQEMDRTPPQGVKLNPKPIKAPVKYGDEDEEFLYGPTDQPNVPLKGSAMHKRAPAPEKIYRYLPELLQAAEDPEAPRELHDFVRLLQHHLGA